MIAGFSRSPSFPSSSLFHCHCLSHAAQIHTYTQTDARKHTQNDTRKCSCSKWWCADCPLRLLHYPFLCLLSFLCSHFQPFFSASAPTASVRCVRLFPVLIVLSLVILSPVPHLSAIIKDPVASYVAPVERRACISAMMLA